MGPARMIVESLTPRPGIREQNRSIASHSRRPRYVRFSNRPVGVKRFQTIHHHSLDVARGLVLLFGIGT